MDFKLDENIPADLLSDLSATGHDAVTCDQEGIGGSEDSAIAAHARDEGRILVTFDLDFSDIRRYPPGAHPGIIILRLRSQDILSCRAAFSRVMNLIPEADLRGNVVIVEDTRVRIRRAESLES